jgi:DNA processing protein
MRGGVNEVHPDSMEPSSQSTEQPFDGEICAAALAGLPGMTPVRLAKLLDGFRPVLAWKAVRAGIHPGDPQLRFATSSRETELEEVAERYRREGVKVLLPDMIEYPSMLVGDPGAPAVLFSLGDPAVLEDRPRVAIVGTRSATPYGRQVASEMGHDLAAAGVVVVSGLAAGIDGAAHSGALKAEGDAPAPPVAVVGTGLDVVYPPSNRGLWERVAAVGAVLSESALGTKPHPGVFPARNRIIAALSDVVVVVESHHKGGALYTVEAAARRSIPVCAVPGSVRSRASDGTNALLVDGCAPIRDVDDVLVALALAKESKEEMPGSMDVGHPVSGGSFSRPPEADFGSHPRHPSVPGFGRSRCLTSSWSSKEQAVLDAIDDIPTHLETVLKRTDLSIADVAKTCDRLTESGALVAGPGWWSRKAE